jgi:hypothetical protein
MVWGSVFFETCNCSNDHDAVGFQGKNIFSLIILFFISFKEINLIFFFNLFKNFIFISFFSRFSNLFRLIF